MSNGGSRAADLYFHSPGQIRCVKTKGLSVSEYMLIPVSRQEIETLERILFMLMPNNKKPANNTAINNDRIQIRYIFFIILDS